MNNKQKALAHVGEMLVNNAKLNLTGHVKSGQLRQSIDYEVKDNSVLVGTNVEYAPYVEYGTGAFSVKGDGRKGWWVFVDTGYGDPSYLSQHTNQTYTLDEAVKIKAILIDKGIPAEHVWVTQGQHQSPFLIPALEQHQAEYIDVLLEEFAMEEAKRMLDNAIITVRGTKK